MSEPNESPEVMERREILRRAAWLLGSAISAPAALAILQGCEAKKESKLDVLYVAKFMTEGNMLDDVAEIAEIMIPKTQSSGAKDVGVPMFIDLVLDAVYDKDAKERFNAGYAQFVTETTLSNKTFLQQEPPVRVNLVRHALETALAGDRDPKPFILMVRELTLLGFFTSKAGIDENMTYEAVPTAFHGCVPVSKMKTPVYWE